VANDLEIRLIFNYIATFVSQANAEFNTTRRSWTQAALEKMCAKRKKSRFLKFEKKHTDVKNVG